MAFISVAEGLKLPKPDPVLQTAPLATVYEPERLIEVALAQTVSFSPALTVGAGVIVS
jgi:hypothetical protein